MKPPSSVAGSLTLAVARVASERGARGDLLLRDAGLDPAALDADTRVPRHVNAAVWREAIRRTGDPRFGLTLSASENVGSAMGLVGYLGMTSPTLGEAIERSVRYHRLIKEGTDTRLLRAPDLVTIEETIDLTDDPACIAMSECAAAAYVLLARRWTATLAHPVEVRFQHARPASTAVHDALFGCPVRFDQPSMAVVFEREAMRLPLTTTQPELASYLETMARRHLEKLPKDDIVSAVREVVRSVLSEGDPGLPRVARTLGVSVRTLQRRLLEHGFDYLSLVDEIRCAEALSLVTSSPVPLGEIGYLVGYSDPKAFRRAFRRWTGASPAEMRRGKGEPDKALRTDELDAA